MWSKYFEHTVNSKCVVLYNPHPKIILTSASQGTRASVCNSLCYSISLNNTPKQHSWKKNDLKKHTAKSLIILTELSSNTKPQCVCTGSFKYILWKLFLIRCKNRNLMSQNEKHYCSKIHAILYLIESLQNLHSGRLGLWKSALLLVQ